MRHVMPVRRDLGVRTLFNCLGPIANPAGATHQLIGAFSDELRGMLAETLRALGTKRAWVVRGEDGMDEVSPYGPTRVTELADGGLSERTVSPETFGLAPSKPDAARGGDAGDNARIIEAILSGEAHPARDAVVLNAAAALVVARGLEPREATKRAQELIDQGLAKKKLDDWRSTAKELTQNG
jgi:anthranilate phosphoribosyltransferase